jgi:hypothetical protein
VSRRAREGRAVDSGGLKRRLRSARRAGRRYPPGLRDAVLDHARKAKEVGKSDAALASELGMSLGTLQYWRATERRGKVVPVTIVDTPAAAPGLVIECGRLRVYGLDLDGIAELLRRLA